MIRKLAGFAGMLCCCAMLAACGGSAPSAAGSPGVTASPARSTGGTASPAPSTGGTPSPAWASALGTGITVIPPAPAAPGNGSPAAAVQGFVNAALSGQLSSACAYIEPGFETQCNQNMANAAASQEVGSYDNFAIGYVVIDGTEALVGTTGTSCDSDMTPACETNTDPAAILDSGQSFQTLWTEANTNNPDDNAAAYSLIPCIDINGQWYIDSQGL